MRKIFISYRRSGAEHAAGALGRELRRHFGEAQVFRDKENIAGGVAWREHILESIDQWSVLLVLIDKDWLNVTDERGYRRLDYADDPVRIEILDGGRDKATIIPVLLDDARMPRAFELPPDLRPLAELNAVRLRDSDWHADFEHICRTIEQRGFVPDRSHAQSTRPRGMPIKLIASYIVAGVGLLALFGHPDSTASRTWAVLAFGALLLGARAYQEYRGGKSRFLWASLGAVALGTCATAFHAANGSDDSRDRASGDAQKEAKVARPQPEPVLLAPLSATMLPAASARAVSMATFDNQNPPQPRRVDAAVDVTGSWIDEEDKMVMALFQRGQQVALTTAVGDVRGQGVLNGRRLQMRLEFTNGSPSEMTVDLSPDGRSLLGSYLFEGKPKKVKLSRR